MRKRLLQSKKLISLTLAFLMLLSTVYVGFTGVLLIRAAAQSSRTLTVEAKTSGKTMNNIAGYMNTFNNSGVGNITQDNPKAPHMGLLTYYELMNATGGGISELNPNAHDRDLIDINGSFRFGKLEDLVVAINSILTVGAKPLIKLGGVPFYFTKNVNNPNFNVYGMNINPYPPDDNSSYTSVYYKENGQPVTKNSGFEAYQLYLTDVIQYLINEFGLEEVKTWRWGVTSEYENFDWFHTTDDALPSSKRTSGKSGSEKTVQAFYRLYDYSVQVVINLLGEENTYIGTHAMACSEGLWDERRFITEHLANPNGNFVTGGAVHCDYIGVSYYENSVGKPNQNNFVDTINRMRNTAKSAAAASSNQRVKNMLNNLQYGVDEGRILVGLRRGSESNALTARVMGHTWQAAYDARTYFQMLDNDFDYFCSWSFTTGGFAKSSPSVTYHVAKKTAEMSGEHSYLADVRGGDGTTDIKSFKNSEVNAYATYNTDDSTMRIMAYNFKNSLDYSERTDLTLNVNLPESFKNKEVYVKKSVIDDSSNYFDDWLKDCEENNIPNNAFLWSPDSHNIESNYNRAVPDGVRAYDLACANRAKYKKAAELKTKTEKAFVDSNGRLITSNSGMQANSAVFYEISEILSPSESTVVNIGTQENGVLLNVPETIFLSSTPNADGTANLEYVLDQNLDVSSKRVVSNPGYKNISSGGKIEFYCPGATNVILYYTYGSYDGGTGGSFNIGQKSGSEWTGNNGLFTTTITGGKASNTNGNIEYRIVYTLNGVSYVVLGFTYICKPNTDAVSIINSYDRSSFSTLRDLVQEAYLTVDYNRLWAENKSWNKDNTRFIQLLKTVVLGMGKPIIDTSYYNLLVDSARNFLTNYNNCSFKKDGIVTVKSV